MYKGGYDWSKQFRKSARIVGDVLVNIIHMVNAMPCSMVQCLRPLVDGRKFWILDGDPAAAMNILKLDYQKFHNLIDVWKEYYWF